MKNPVTLEAVLSFPATLPFELIEFHWITLLLPLIGLAGLVMMWIYQEKNELLHMSGEIGFVLGFVLFVIYLMMVPGSIHPAEEDKYDAYYTEWVHEYVKPYIDTLPERKIELKKVEYNRLMEEEHKENYQEKGIYFYGEEGTPVKATDLNGGEYSLWATVVYEEGLTTDYLTAHHLQSGLRFTDFEISHFIPKNEMIAAGLQNVVLHTGNPSFEKYATQEEGTE